MAYKKLIYSGKECHNYLCFSFYADFFNTERITYELKIKPTSVMIKSNPVPKSTAWMYQVTAGQEINLEKYIEKLLDVFEPKIESINKLKGTLDLQTHLQFVIDIDINPDASTPFFDLNKRTIHFLSKTDTEVSFDLYKSDTMNLLLNFE